MQNDLYRAPQKAGIIETLEVVKNLALAAIGEGDEHPSKHRLFLSQMLTTKEDHQSP